RTHRSHGPGRSAGADAFGRAGQPGVPGRGDARISRAARPRRTHGGPRPRAESRSVGDLPQTRRRRHDSGGLEPCDGRGHPLRPAAAHARGRGDRGHDPCGAADEHGGRLGGGGVPADHRAGLAGHSLRSDASAVAEGGTALPEPGPAEGRPAMRPMRTLATAGRVLHQIRNDPRTIVLLLVVPSLLIGLVAWIFDETDVFASIGPAMLALFPFTVMFLVTSIATLRERRSGTLERLL